MTRDELFDLAEKAGLGFIRHASDKDVNKFEKLAALVASAEREACAKLCETLWDTPTNGMATEEQSYGDKCASAIRARGQA